MNDDQNTPQDQNEEHPNHTAAKVALGAAAVVGAAVVANALRSEDTREKISDAATDAKDKIQDKFEEVKDNITDSMEDRIDDLLRKIEDIKEQVETAATQDENNEEFVSMQDDLDTWSERLQSAKDQGLDNADDLLGEIGDAMRDLRNKLDRSSQAETDAE